MARLILSLALWGLSALATAADFTGRVVSEGRGVVGATLRAIPYETRHATALREARGGANLSAIATTSTSAEGRFRLAVPETAPPFVVLVTFGGLAARTVDGVFEKSDSEDLGEISLARGETVSGRVVDGNGKPVQGALVRLGRDGAPVATNKEGLFRFDDVEGRGSQPFQAQAVLSVHAAGFEVQAVSARFSGSPATVRLQASGRRLFGVLRDWNGKPAQEAVIRVSGGAVTRWVRTDAAGRFEIPGAPSKQARLQALGRDGSSLETTVTVGPYPLILTLGRAGVIEGRVTQIETGKLIASVKVAARAAGTTILARTGVDGRYRISSLPQGSYRLTFDDKRFVLVSRRDIEVAGGETKTLDIALTLAVSLVGRVSDEEGRPVAGARGSLSPGTETRMRILRALGRDDVGMAFTSGLDGTFKANRLAPGTNQRLTVVHPEYERRVVPGVDLVQGRPKPLSIEVVLSPGYVLEGVVRDKDGQPIQGAQVTLNRSLRMQGGGGGNVVQFNTIETVRPQAETDFEGKFGFRGLSEGDYDVSVSKVGFTRHVSNGVKAGAEASPLDVALAPGASIAGRLVQSNGQPVTGYQVAARPSAPGQSAPRGLMMPMMGRGDQVAQPDPDGGFLLEGLTPGTAYDLSLLGAGEFRGEARKKGVVAPAEGVEIEVATRGRIVGRVIDAASGAPITEFEARYSQARGGGMQIVLRGPGETDRRTPFSSADGAFAFEDVPPGNWDVTVWAKTYQDARTGGVAVAANETKSIEVKAARGLVIRGRVVDAKGGRGVQDATVTAREEGGGGGFMFDPEGLSRGGVITDADGRFEIVDKGPGAYQLTARHSLFSEGTAWLVLDDRDAAVDIPVVAGAVIGGVVTSPQGAPLSGAAVSLQNSGDQGGMRFGLEGLGTLSDGTGRFRFEHLAAGRYKVSATLRTETSPVIDVPVNAGDVREDIRLSLDAGATVRGVVVGLPENERSGVVVGARGAQDYFGNARTNADGAFEFTGVPSGTLSLRATAGDPIFGSSHTATREMVAPEGEAEVRTEIVFEEGFSISGTVMRRGVPVAGARVSAFMTGTGRQASTRVDESGAFRIAGLEPGRVNVIAFAENFESQVSQVVELTASTTVDLVIPTARFRGTVLDEASGLPLESTVELQRAAVSGPVLGQMRMNVSTDSSGRFAFDDLEPVDYRLTARRSGYESLTKTIKPSEAGEDLRLELKRGSGLSIEANDAQMGFGLRELFVRVQGGGTDAFGGTISLDSEGKGEIPGLPPGNYVVTAQASGYAPVRIPNVMAPSMVLRLALTPGGTAEFRTIDDFIAGGPKSGQLVSLSGAPLPAGPGGPNSFRLSRLTQRTENLTPGRYRLTLDGGFDRTFEVTEGGVTVVTIP